MKGFGYFNNFDDLQKLTAKFEHADLIPMEDEDPEDFDNVEVPLLDKGDFIKSTTTKDEKKPKGSAASPNPNDGEGEDDDSIFGNYESLGGMGLNLDKELATMEAFQPGQSVDDSGEATAHDRTDLAKRDKLDTSDVKKLFDEMFSKNYTGPGAGKYTYDQWAGNQNTIIDLGVKKTFDSRPVTNIQTTSIPMARIPNNQANSQANKLNKNSKNTRL